MPSVLPTAVLALVVCAGMGACSRDEEPAPAPSGSLSGVLLDAQLAEISGLAASRRFPDVLWLHDDGGNPARLFAVNTSGDRVATLRVDGVVKTDWEDLAAFQLRGREYLLIADTGDNGGLRHTVQLHVLQAPARLENARIRPAWSIAFRWPEGARDCEAVAVDVARGQILLVSKRRQPPELFAVPLRPGKGIQTAVRLGALAGIPAADPEEMREDPRRARVVNQVTAADLSPDGTTLAVLTYRHVLLYRREAQESWGSAVARAPKIHALPWIPQAEALGWSRDGKSLYVTGEFVPAPLYRIAP